MRIIPLAILILFVSANAWAEPTPPIPTVTVSSTTEEDIQSQKTVITQQNISTSGANTLADVLQNLGGVQLQDMTGSGSQVMMNIRGFGANASSNSLLLINGIPITNPDMAPPDLNAIPLQDIASIEIVSGSESVLYGDQAVGGIVNIITQQQANDKTEISCGVGSYSQHNCYAAINRHYKQLKYGIGLLNQHTDNYRQHNDYGQNQVAGGFNYLYPQGKLGFDYQIARENLLYPGGLTSSQVAENRRQATNRTDYFKNWNGFYRLHQQQQLHPHWYLITDIARREAHGSGILTSAFDQSRVNYFVKPQIKGTIANTLIMSGIDFEDDNYRLSSLFGPVSDSQQKYGLFVLANMAMTPKLSFSAGARAAMQKNHLRETVATDHSNQALATTLGVSYQLLQQMKVYLRRAESFRFPKADEDASTLGDIPLKTQKGVSYEAGVEGYWKKSLTKFSVYQLNLVREITFDPNQTPMDPFGTNRNLDPTVRQGFTFSESYRLTDKLNISGQYNYVNARFASGADSGNRIPLVAENFIHAGINYQLTEHWGFYTEASYSGNQYPANDDANTQGKMGGYTLYNVNLRYQYQQLIASLRINNIFNKYYYFYSTYQPSMANVFFYPAPGRNLLLTVKYEIL